MQPFAVVVDLDKLEDGSLGFNAGSEAFLGVNEFPFDGSPEAFDDRIDETGTFAVGTRQDDQAVRSALALPWSNVQTEGQVTRLTFIKRQLYSRANFDLLRQRVLLGARPPLTRESH